MLTKLFGDKQFVRAALRLALPVAFQNMLLSSFALVDTIMIGNLGSNPLAAVGMAGQLSFMLNLILFGFNSGAAVFIAQYWGAKDMDGIRRTYGLALLCALGASCVFLVIGSCFPETVIRLFTQDELVIPYGVDYLRIASLSYIALAASQIASTVLRSTEEVKLPMYSSIVSVLMNALFNWLLIYVLDMGVRGAAIATVISAFSGCAIVWIVSLKKGNILRAAVRQMTDWKNGFLPHYFKISFPALLNETLWGLGTVVCKLIYSNKSTEFYAALTAYASIDGVAFAFFVGVCHACGVMVGKDVGAGRPQDAIIKARRFILYIFSMALIMCGILVPLRGVLVLPFDIGESARAIAKGIVVVYAVESLLRYIPYITVVGIFRAGGDTKIGLFFDVGCLWGVSVPITYLCAFVWNLDLTLTVIIMLLAEDLVKAMLCLWHFKSRRWIKPVNGYAGE